MNANCMIQVNLGIDNCSDGQLWCSNGGILPEHRNNISNTPGQDCSNVLDTRRKEKRASIVKSETHRCSSQPQSATLHPLCKDMSVVPYDSPDELPFCTIDCNTDGSSVVSDVSMDLNDFVCFPSRMTPCVGQRRSIFASYWQAQKKYHGLYSPLKKNGLQRRESTTSTSTSSSCETLLANVRQRNDVQHVIRHDDCSVLAVDIQQRTI